MLNIIINTFKEIIRNKYLYIILFFAIIFIIFSLSLSELSIWKIDKIIIDFWLSMIEIFGVIWVLFIWSQLLFKEIEWKTIFLILSKPIKKSNFIIWKFLWFSLSILVIILIESLLFLFILFLQEIEVSKIIIFSIINTFLKLEILLTLVFFFSSFMSSLITIISSILIYFLSHNFSIILDLAYNTKNNIIIYFSKIIWIIIPNFEALNTKDLIWSYSNLSNLYFLQNIWISIIYIIFIFIFTNFIFSKKEFE